MSPRRLLRSAYRLVFPLLALAALIGPMPAPASAASANLVKNPGCESDAGGWYGWQGTIARTTAVRHLGAAACQVTYGGSGGSYTLDDSPATVAKPAAGASYRAYAWVRTDTATGRPLRLVLRQSGGAKAQASVSSQLVALSSTWQQISVQITIDAADRETLEVYLSQGNARAGDRFQADGIVLTGGNVGTSGNVATWNKSGYPGAIFSASSAWNTPIPAAAKADAKSALMLSTTNPLSLGYALAHQGGFRIAHDNYGYSAPVWYSDSNVAAVQVRDANGWFTCAGCAYDLSPVRIPANALAARGADGHMVVWDTSNHTVYEFWQARKHADGSWSAGVAVAFDEHGPGYRAFTDHWHNGARAFGGSLLGGLIRYQEVKGGTIKHALSFAYPTPQNRHYAQGLGADGVTPNIASHADGDGANADSTANIPEGARIRLKAGVDVTARCAAAPHPAACRTIGNALRDYGAYLVDRSGHPAFAAEDLTGKDVSWNGVLEARDTSGFRPGDFEVLSLPSPLQAR